MITRRRLIASTLGAGAALATAGCMTTLSSSKRMVVDAQVHVWNADRQWGGVKPQMPEPFTIEKLVPMMDEAGVDRVVIVPPTPLGNGYGLEAAKRYPGRFAVMGPIALKDPKSAELLPKWRSQPGMLGVRLLFAGPTEKWLTDGTADWFWPVAERAGVPVMFLAPEKGPEFGRIAERHPRLNLIIDHMGLSAAIVSAGRTLSAIEHALSLAKYPNLSVKLSAAPNYSSQPYPYRDMYQHIRRLFAAFGPQRCYWGTDITNAFEKATYQQRIAHFTETLDFLTEEDKDWVMGRGILARLNWA